MLVNISKCCYSHNHSYDHKVSLTNEIIALITKRLKPVKIIAFNQRGPKAFHLFRETNHKYYYDRNNYQDNRICI